MKRTAAFLLSLTLVWLQVMGSVQPVGTPAADQTCGCCAGQPACCCVTESAPVSVPLPATPAPAPVTVDFTAVLARVVAWTLPATGPAIVSSADSSSAASSACPLFQRDCALLI
jgi:hypothetical protein